jgi:hypothetical protein
MKVSSVLTVLAAATAVSAQLDQIPPCALTCAISSLGSTGCGQTDIACICKSSSFITGLTPCVQASCSAADFEKTIKAATVLCAQGGVTLSIPVASATSALASASSAASSILSYASSSASSSSSAVYASISSIASSLSSVYINATVTTHVPVPTGNMTYTTGTVVLPSPTGTGIPVPSPSGNAAGRNAITLGGLGAAAVVFAAALL